MEIIRLSIFSSQYIPFTGLHDRPCHDGAFLLTHLWSDSHLRNLSCFWNRGRSVQQSDSTLVYVQGGIELRIIRDGGARTELHVHKLVGSEDSRTDIQIQVVYDLGIFLYLSGAVRNQSHSCRCKRLLRRIPLRHILRRNATQHKKRQKIDNKSGCLVNSLLGSSHSLFSFLLSTALISLRKMKKENDSLSIEFSIFIFCVRCWVL